MCGHICVCWTFFSYRSKVILNPMRKVRVPEGLWFFIHTIDNISHWREMVVLQLCVNFTGWNLQIELSDVWCLLHINGFKIEKHSSSGMRTFSRVSNLLLLLKSSNSKPQTKCLLVRRVINFYTLYWWFSLSFCYEPPLSYKCDGLLVNTLVCFIFVILKSKSHTPSGVRAYLRVLNLLFL